MSNKERVLITGHFNVLHPGHQRLFAFAKTVGKRLIVGVESDRIAGEMAYFDESQRYEGVNNNSLVDEVILFDEPVENLIKSIKPDFVIKGTEHDGKYNPEETALRDIGGKLLFHSGTGFPSNIEFRQKKNSDTDKTNVAIPEDFVERHKINLETLTKIILNFSKKRVLVIGDLIVDEYINCEALGLSQEDANPVFRTISSKRYIGGAAIVASHIAALGASVKFFSLTGEDENAEFAKTAMLKNNVEIDLFSDASRPTTLKQRFRVSNQSRFRLSKLSSQSIPSDFEEKIFARVEKSVADADLIIFSDFNYGLLTKRLIGLTSSLAKRNDIPVIVDSQSSSQVGDLTQYKNLLLLTPTEREARISLKDKDGGLVSVAESLRKQVNSENILLKLGGDGVIIHTVVDNMNKTDRLPALNHSPKDVSGAGDALLSVSSLAMVTQASIWEAALLGSIAAAIQISQIGNVPISYKQLLKEL